MIKYPIYLIETIISCLSSTRIKLNHTCNLSYIYIRKHTELDEKKALHWVASSAPRDAMTAVITGTAHTHPHFTASAEALALGCQINNNLSN